MVDNAFDLRLFKAKNQIDDALGVNRRGQQPMLQQPMQQGQPPRANANLTPNGMQIGAQVPTRNGQFDIGAQMRVNPKGVSLQQLQAQYSNPKFSAGVGYDPQQRGVNANLRVPFKKGGLAMAEGGGAWTRKEGKNPEGGLNAKGRASLRAQGKDIKPPVSAKQAKKSPKAAARRKSFCARSAGQAKMFPDAARDPDSRLNKARRKWDC
jgi:hypothetical protein